ncbi:hypothetical protein [Streptomyces sp. NPDC003023]|uniref:hypothetical protein n=1 Tax=Streptomyces sp. NPDC003023 TaxID=3364675 RepID=UPI0036CD5502
MRLHLGDPGGLRVSAVAVVKADAANLTKQQGSSCCAGPAAADTDAREPVSADGC